MHELSITRIEAFFRGLHRRVPRGDSDASVAARRAIEHDLGALNARMLGRDHDARVPVDIDAMAIQIADRMDRYSSADWKRNNVVGHARAAVDRIAAAVRTGSSGEVDEVDEWGDPPTDEG